MIDYLCQQCNQLTEHPISRVDLPYILVCQHCDGETVIDLVDPKIRVEAFRALMAWDWLKEFYDEASHGPYSDSDLTSLLETLRQRARVILGIEED